FDLPGGRTDIAKLEQYDPRHVYQTANGVLDEVFASDTTLGQFDWNFSTNRETTQMQIFDSSLLGYLQETIESVI
ncbi:MAG: hypothetical protein LBJ67_02205, partial [Planctomycetaceae bacterium]|nr:hypothetical protein [Planctomycetaceae bacterium]